MTYLKLSDREIGFLLNWNVTLMRHGIKRVVLNLDGSRTYPKHFKKVNLPSRFYKLFATSFLRG